MAIRTYKVTLDSKNYIAPEPVLLRQGDKTGAVVIDATLLDNGSPVSLDGLTPSFMANTADGKAVIADSTGFNIVNASGGKFTYKVSSKIGSVPGKIRTAYFSFADASGNQSTFDVAFIINKSADMTQESAKDWVSTLSEIIEQYNQWANDAHNSWEQFVNDNKAIIESIDPGGKVLSELIGFRHSDMLSKTFDTAKLRGDFFDQEFAGRGVNVKWFGADSEGVNDSTQAFIDTVAYCRNIALASDYHRIPLVLIPSGIYKITDTIILPPYIKLVVQGFATIMADVPNNSVIHITAQSDDKPFTIGRKQQHLRSPIINADNGGLLIRSVTDRVPGTTAIEIGSVTDLGAQFPTSRYTLSDVSVDGFDIAVQMNIYNNYIGSFERVMFEVNNTVMRFGETVGNVTNSGENISFYNSLFATANTGFEHLVDGFNCNFYGCSSDFIDTLFDFKRGYKIVNYFGGHIEGVKKVAQAQYAVQLDWLSPATLNLYSPIVLSGSYPLFTGNLRLNADKVRWENTKIDFKRIYLCDEKVVPTEVSHEVQGHEVFLSDNLNILSDKDFKSLSGYTVSSGNMTEPKTVTLAPDNELTGTALKSISTADSSTWLEIKSKHFTVRPGETIQNGINIYMQADIFRLASMMVAFYDIDGNRIDKNGKYAYTVGAVPNEWCEIFGNSMVAPQGAVEASVICTVSDLKTDEFVLLRDFGIIIS